MAVVIAAYNEAGGIGAVLDAMPSRTGHTDPARSRWSRDDRRRRRRYRRHRGGRPPARRATCAEMPGNRGQGAALRLGYYLARTGGARYIVTTDADGQYDIAQLPALLDRCATARPTSSPGPGGSAPTSPATRCAVPGYGSSR